MIEAGYGIVRGVVSEDEVEALRGALAEIVERAYGVRQLFDRVPGLLELASSAKITQLVEPLVFHFSFLLWEVTLPALARIKYRTLNH